MTGILTPRWTPLIAHPEQLRLDTSPARFKVVPAGRRSGKTEKAKRKIVTAAMDFFHAHNGRFVAAAPTRKQAKDIYWADLKALTPTWALADWERHPISESDLTIKLFNGARIEVRGMDAPHRIEGDPIDGIVLDEYANMHAHAWTDHVRPGLFTLGRPPGWAWLIGVPEGRNHYYQMWRRATEENNPDWDGFTWKSIDILPPEEVAAAREDLDELTFRQEYEADFVTFAGRAYYCFDWNIHASERVGMYYDDTLPLDVCFDFNVRPGTCVICQEIEYEGTNGHCADRITAVIDEVWIPNNSTTPQVCEKFLRKFADHQGSVRIWGDPAGGHRGTAKVAGSDWDIIKERLGSVFGDRLEFNIASSDPGERPRVNAVNSRLKSSSGTVRLLIDPKTAAHTAEDLDGVRVTDEGYIDKRSDPMLTHLADGLAYYLHRRHRSGEDLSATQL